MSGERRFGRFELREELGAGAMGTVYRAWDPVAEREIALKVLSLPLAAFPEAERKGLLARFEREARLAASLEHPGIARVLGAGEAEGAPWIAMELVRGETLSERIGRRRSEPDFRREAARLVAEAAEAIESAHGRGVIHRDLKPANILVEDESGRARVTDFGLAREIAPGSRIGLTQEGQILGTPQYMAPEQARGEMDELDAQTDVYGLGATLFEALTGRPPYEGDVAWKVALAVVRGECPPPRALDDTIPEELDAICRCAIARTKEARYASAAELAQELRAWLAGKRRVRGKPLVPRGPSLGRAIRLAVQRNKAVTATIAAALAVLVAGGAVFVWRLRIERDRAEKRAQVARDALDTLVFEVKERLQGESSDRVRKVRQSLLENALAGVERLRNLDVEAEPISLTAAEAHRQVGDLATLVGKLDKAGEAYERAADVSHRMLERHPGGYTARADLAESLSKLSSNRYERGDAPGSLAAAVECLALRRGLVAEAPEVDGARQAVALALGDVAMGRQRQGDLKGARAALEEAIVLAREVNAHSPKEQSTRAPLAGLIESLADVLDETGDVTAAARAHEEALEIYRGLLAEDPTSPGGRILFVNGLRAVGLSRKVRGDSAGALQAYQEAIGIARQLLAEDPKSLVARSQLAMTLAKLATLKQDEGDLEGAFPVIEEAVALTRDDAAGSVGNALSLSDLARYMSKLGDLRKKRGDDAGALKAYEEALAISRDLAKRDPTDAKVRLDISVALERIAEMKSRRGDMDGSRATLEECLAIRRDLAAKDPASAETRRGVAIACLNLGDLREQKGDLAGARASYEEALASLRELKQRDPGRLSLHRDSAGALQRMADILEKLGEFDEAIARLDEAIEILKSLAAKAPQLGREVAVLEAQRRRARDGKRASELLSGKSAAAGPGDHLALGYVLYDRKDYAQSAEHFARALEDDAIRADDERGNLYNGACAAALASAAATGEPAAAWRARALEWLGADIARARAALEKASGATRARLLAHLDHARTKDEDLASLRGTPEFAKIFEAAAAPPP